MDVVMPQLGETVTEGTVTQWYKRVGDAIAEHESLFDVETDKVASEIPAPATGVLAEILVPAGATVKVGTRLAVIRTKQSHTTSQQQAPSAAPASAALTQQATGTPQLASAAEGAKLSPVVRRLLAEHQLEPAAVSGSGRDGRITRDDVLGHIERARKLPSADPQPVAVQAPAAAPAPAPPAAPAPATLAAHETVVPLNSVRRRSAAQLAKSWSTIPHVLQAVEADFHAVEKARSVRAAHWKSTEGFTLTYLPFVARAVCNALGQFPQLNARLDGDNLVLSRRINLGVAVDLGHDGLIVPVIKDAQDKTLRAIARELHGLAARARAHELKPDELTQATYTLSNSGVFGTLITAPIINPPQVAILSTDGVRKKPVVLEGPQGDVIAIRPVGVLAQSFDHRAVDGAYSAAFLRAVKDIIEQRDWLQDLPV